MKEICIVGCGQIARMYAKKLAGRACLRFQSRRVESAEALNAQYGGSGVFRTYSEALERSDAVIICSPPEAHKEQAISALRAGKHVLVEKPLCISREELDEIERASLASPRCQVMVGENYYYKPSLAKIKEIIASGAIGEVRTVRIRRKFTNKLGGWRSAYGALIEGGIHYVAIISALMDDEAPLAIEAQFPESRALPGHAPLANGSTAPERSFFLNLGYRGGKRAELDYSWETKAIPHGFFQTSRIEGTTGSITFESNGLWVTVVSSSMRKTFYPDLRDFLGQKRMVNDFLRTIEEGTAPHSGLERAKRDMSIVFEAYERRRESRQAASA